MRKTREINVVLEVMDLQIGTKWILSIEKRFKMRYTYNLKVLGFIWLGTMILATKLVG